MEREDKETEERTRLTTHTHTHRGGNDAGESAAAGAIENDGTQVQRPRDPLFGVRGIAIRVDASD